MTPRPARAVRALTKREVAAMWLWSKEYAAQRAGAIEFYQALDAQRRKVVDEFLNRLAEAEALSAGGRP